MENINAQDTYKKDFVSFMVECGALKFGQFTLKSGRKSPFFMNAGVYTAGGDIARLGEYYARAIRGNFGNGFDVIFGPAYKGIPIAVAASIAWRALYGEDKRWASNRKEAKDHGEEGIILGGPIKDGDKVVIVEDVTTSGKSIEETLPVIMAQGNVRIVGEVVSLDRMERAAEGTDGGQMTALQTITARHGFPAAAIVTMKDVVSTLYTNGDKTLITESIKSSLNEYYAKWGAAGSLPI